VIDLRWIFTVAFAKAASAGDNDTIATALKLEPKLDAAGAGDAVGT
jgi:hypothetical protein